MNIEKIKASIRKAINKMPTEIVLQRYEKIDDGMGGYILSPDPITVSTFNAILDNSKGSIRIPILESGSIKRISNIQIIAEYNNTFDIQIDDFFIVKGKKYRIVNVTNLLNLDICWQCEVEEVE